MTAATELLGIQLPLLLAPMGDVAGGRLAAAVSEAGGLGLIGGGYADPEWLEHEIDAAGDARVGVGFITFALHERPSSLDLALRAKPAAVQLSFGDPTAFVDKIHDAGAQLICQVQDVEEARRCVAAGADLIVAQGLDAGGHGRPVRGTLGLVPAIVDAVAPVPVVAAGGIADGRGLAAALMLGASAVALGTRFSATHEALSDRAAKALLTASTARDTIRTSAFDVVRGPSWPAGHDARALRNDLTAAWQSDDIRNPNVVANLKDQYRQCASDDFSMRPVWAGEGVDLVRSVCSAEDVVHDVCTSGLALARGVRAWSDGFQPDGDEASEPRARRRPHRPTAQT